MLRISTFETSSRVSQGLVNGSAPGIPDFTKYILISSIRGLNESTDRGTL